MIDIFYVSTVSSYCMVVMFEINASLGTRQLPLFLLTDGGAEGSILTEKRLCFTTFLNAKRGVENMTCSRVHVFWTESKMFGNVMEYCLVYISQSKLD